MTVVGKILVFVNLVFSLVVGGLVMMVYMTRTNWEAVAKGHEDRYKAVQAAQQQKEEEQKVLEKQAKDANKILEDKIAALEKELKTATTDRDTAREQLAAIKTDDSRGAAQTTALQQSVAAREMQVKELTDRNLALHKEKVTLIEEKNEERKARIQSDVEARLYKSRNLELVSAVQDLQRELTKAKLGPNPAGAVAVRKRGDENPPPDNVEGRVRTVDPESNLLTLTIGSDHGLAQGHTLKVFRLSPIPEQSRFLGTIEILAVKPHEAVGRPVSRTPYPIRPNDRVASRLLVGSN